MARTTPTTRTHVGAVALGGAAVVGAVVLASRGGGGGTLPPSEPMLVLTRLPDPRPGPRPPVNRPSPNVALQAQRTPHAPGTTVTLSRASAGAPALDTQRLDANGQATFLIVLPLGTANLQVTDGTLTAHLQVVVQPAGAPNVALTVAPNPAPAGATVTMNVAVTPSATGDAVDFLDGATSLGYATLGAAPAHFTTPPLAAGSHVLTARLATSVGPVTSNAVTLIVQGGGPPVGGKPVMAGVLDHTSRSPNWPSAATSPGGFVVTVNWSDIEPTQGAFSLSSIDGALAHAAAAAIPVKLRVLGGAFAPPWVFAAAGSVPGYIEGQSGTTYTIPKVWSGAYIGAYNAMMATLAAHYDPHPWFGCIVDSGPMAVYAEPFQLANPHSAAVLAAAGYTDGGFVVAIKATIDAAGAAWHHTPVALSYNPFKPLSGAPRMTECDTVMAYQRQVLGPSTIIENNSWDTSRSWTDPLYALMAHHGAPLCLQSATVARGGTPAALAAAAANPALWTYEMPSWGSPAPSAATIAGWQAALRHNAGA